MIIQNPANAFTLIRTATTSVACDPWITDGIYEGAWHVYPPIRSNSDLGWVDAVLITHVHADHLDPAALELTGEAHIFLPDLYPNRSVCARRLSAAVQRRVRFVPVSTSFVMGDLTFEFIPPMNRYGHRVELYEADDRELTAIDTGIVVSDGDATAVLLADNFPYCLTSAGDTLTRMEGCDAVFFPYNACADDYPVCHDNLTAGQKRAKSLERNQKRVSWLAQAFHRLRPKVIVPYSSDFMLAGSRAQEFIEVHSPDFVDKRLAARLYESACGIPSRALFEADRLILGHRTFGVVSGPTPQLDFKAVAAQLATVRTGAADRRPRPDDELRSLFFPAAHQMIKKAQLRSEWCLELECVDSGLVLSVDLSTGSALDGPSGRVDKVLRCSTSSGYLADLLSFKTHWDNAMIGYHLSWHRCPDEYDVGLYKALNFLHVQLKAAT